MRIFISNPPFIKHFNRQVRWAAKTSGGLHPPIYLAYAAAVLKKAGFDVKLEDAVAEGRDHEQFLQDIRAFKPDMIVMETSTASIFNDSRLAEKVRKVTKSPLVFTGSHCSALPRRTLKESVADIVTIGEYDETLLDLARTLKAGKPLKGVRGIAFKQGRKITVNEKRPLIKDLDDLPWPLRDQLPTNAYSDTLLTTPFTFIVTARGCPYLCNYCLDGKSSIIIKKAGKIQVKKILELFNPNSECIFSDGSNEVSDLRGTKIGIWDGNRFVRLKSVSRRKANNLLSIKLSGGRSINMTREHRVPIRRQGKEMLIEARKISIGDSVSMLADLPEGDSREYLNLLEEFVSLAPKKLLRDVYVQGLKQHFHIFERMVGDLKKSWKQRGILPINRFYDLYKSGAVPERALRDAKIGGRNILPIPLIFKLTPDFLRLLGYFVSEGNYSNYSIVLTSNDSKTIGKWKKMIRDIFEKSYISVQKNQLFFGGLTVYMLFRHVLGIPKGAKNKRVSDIIFNLPQNLQAEFLRGCFSGDGDWDGRGKIRYSTISPLLKDQISYLLTSMGIKHSFCVQDQRGKQIFSGGVKTGKIRNILFRIVISDWDNREKFISKIGFLDEKKNLAIRRRQEQSKPYRIKLLENLNHPMKTTELAEIVGSSRVQAWNELNSLNHEGFVKRKCVGKIGFIKEVEFFRIKDSTLRDSNNRFLDVLSIEKKSHNDHVYDLTTESGLFTANGIVVHNCNWPSTMFGRGIRKRDPIKIVDEVEHCIKTYRLKSYKFFDDTLTVDKRHVKAICNELLKRGITTPWICNARVDTLDEETMRIMKKAGCYLFKIGVESGNQDILDWIKKGTKLEQIRSFFKLMKKVGMQSFASFMIGYPQETMETIEQTFSLAKEIQPDMCQFVILQPLPGTELWGWMEKKGMIPKDLSWDSYITDEGYVDLVFKHPKFSQKELHQICSRLWSGYYMRPGYVLKRMAKPSEWKRNLKGIRKIFRYRNI